AFLQREDQGEDQDSVATAAAAAAHGGGTCRSRRGGGLARAIRAGEGGSAGRDRVPLRASGGRRRLLSRRKASPPCQALVSSGALDPASFAEKSLIRVDSDPRGVFNPYDGNR